MKRNEGGLYMKKKVIKNLFLLFAIIGIIAIVVLFYLSNKSEIGSNGGGSFSKDESISIDVGREYKRGALDLEIDNMNDDKEITYSIFDSSGKNICNGTVSANKNENNIHVESVGNKGHWVIKFKKPDDGTIVGYKYNFVADNKKKSN